jgi:hypothetical protein
VYISQSELITADPKYTEEYIKDNPIELERTLWSLGLDTNQPYEHQEVTHRNRFGNIISCPRFIGVERLDKEWIESGYASEEALAKRLNNKLVNDLFRLKGLTE